MKQTTPQQRWQLLYTANSTASSIAATIPTLTEPVAGANGFWATTLPNDDGVFNYCNFVFFGAGSDNQTGNVKIVGWKKINDVWIPIPLLLLALTFSAAVGIDGHVPDDTDRFADTITATTAYTTAYEIISPAGDQIAMVKLDVVGFDFVQVLTDTVNINALAAGY